MKKKSEKYYASKVETTYLPKTKKPRAIKKPKKENQVTLLQVEKLYKELISQMKGLSYEDYLKTTHWKEYRKQSLEYADNCCQLCGESRITLHVHHKTYRTKCFETFNDTIVLCEECHKKQHHIL